MRFVCSCKLISWGLNYFLGSEEKNSFGSVRMCLPAENLCNSEASIFKGFAFVRFMWCDKVITVEGHQIDITSIEDDFEVLFMESVQT